MQDLLGDVYDLLLGPALVLAPANLALGAFAAWVVYRRQRQTGGFWGWLMPRRIWLHRSHLIDLQLFLLSRVMAGVGLVGLLTVTTLVAAGIASWLPAPLLSQQALSPLALAFLMWLPTDFAIYWVHRLYHRWGLIWPLHAVHHSAEVLTPITTYRQHPLASVLTLLVQSGIVGLIQGLVLGTLGAETDIAMIAGINAFIILSNAGLSALHHSHIWLSYGPVIEHIVISPAQHQIHHSTDPAHHDRNYGNALALWDWMFGTLYVIRKPESLTFGLTADADGPLMRQRLWPILADPIRRMFRSG